VSDVVYTGGNHRSDELASIPRDRVSIVANPVDEPAPFLMLIDRVEASIGLTNPKIRA
jgi:hypothetical protein